MRRLKLKQVARCDIKLASAFGLMVVALVLFFGMRPSYIVAKESSSEKEVAMEITITKDNFASEVLKSDCPVLVDFWAPWCGPCQMLAPILAQVAEEMSGRLKVAKANVDEAPELAADYGISGIPALLLFDGGRVVASRLGLASKAEIETFVNQHTGE